MNKADLIKTIAEAADISQASATKAIEAVFDSVTDTLKSGDEVALGPLGKLSVTRREARKGRNPQTGEEIQIAARNAIKFTAGKHLKDAVN